MPNESESLETGLQSKSKGKKSKKTLQAGSKLSNNNGSQMKSNSRSQIKSQMNSNTSFEKPAEEKLHEMKDTSELLMDTLTSIIEPVDEFKNNYSINSESVNSEPRVPQVPLSSNDFADMASQVFIKFKRSIVIAHRYKQWTQLQNACKLMYNCVNTLIVFLPGVSFNNRKLFRLNDLWRSVYPCMYLAAENLLDMIFYTIPIEVRNLTKFNNGNCLM